MPHDRYHEAVDYLQRRLWHELPIISVERALQQRIRHLLAHFGDPHLAFPVIHVGGSAGKGSTSAIIASILRAAGLQTGAYTSPHLQTFIERIDIDGTLIPPDRFADLVLGLDPLVRQMHMEILDGVGFGRPSLVEVAFAVAMKHFAGEQVDVAVVEVGLGGRTDCTNVFDHKPVSVITNIELEHTERLGKTRAAIAREKAAIIRGGEIAVTGERHRDALAVIEQRCDDVGVDLRIVGRPPAIVNEAALPLPGAHQAKNAALAVAAARAFAERTGKRIEDDAITRGLREAWIPGRMETVQQYPRVILDGAHNPAEARALADALRRHVIKRGTKIHLVCGILADKNQSAMARALADIAASVVVTQPPLVERQGDPAPMVALFEHHLGKKHVAFEKDPEGALDLALTRARATDAVVVTGSMFLIGHLRNRWLPEREILRRRSSRL